VSVPPIVSSQSDRFATAEPFAVAAANEASAKTAKSTERIRAPRNALNSSAPIDAATWRFS